jgi:hypothetical protein
MWDMRSGGSRSTPRTVAFASLGVLCASLATRGAHAQTPPSETAAGPRLSRAEADRRAFALYEEGSAAFAREDYSTAAARFEAAFALSPRPRILYNLGVTYDRLELPQQAIDAYERYLNQLPNAPEREEVDARLRVLRAEAEIALERSQALNVTAATPSPQSPSARATEPGAPAAPSPAHTGRTVGIVLGSLAVAGTGATVGVYVFASNYYQGLRRDCGDLRHETDPNAPWCSRTVLDDVQLRTTLTNTLMFGTIGLAIASGISFVVDAAQSRRAATSVTPRSAARATRRVGWTLLPSPDGATLWTGGTF